MIKNDNKDVNNDDNSRGVNYFFLCFGSLESCKFLNI